MKRTLNEATAQKIFVTLLEKFGEPICSQNIIKESPELLCQCGGMLTTEGICESCGMMSEMTGLDQVTPAGGEKVVKALKKQSDVDNPYAVAWSMKDKGQLESKIFETRERVSPGEIEAAFDELYMQSGDLITLESLSSWIGTTSDAVLRDMPSSLRHNPKTGEIYFR